jgi:DNA polymerase-3 subunit epsilon
VLDFELTGLDRRRDEIVSYGAIPIEEGRIRLRSATSGLVRPARTLSEPSILVHGIRPAELARAPSIDDALSPLLRALTGRVLVAHTAAVETTFLRRALRRHRLRLRGPVIDTEVLGRLWLWERDERLRTHLKLAELAAALGLPADRPHVAVGDALTTAQVFLALAAHLDTRHPQTVASLARAERRLQSLKVFNAGQRLQ